MREREHKYRGGGEKSLGLVVKVITFLMLIDRSIFNNRIGEWSSILLIAML